MDTIQTTVLAQSLSDFTCNLWRRNPIDFGSRSHRSRSTLPPPLCEGMPCFALSSFFCYERDFMSNLHKSKQYGLIDMFNDTSRYLDDIFTIDNPEFEKHIPDIYPTELQLNKAITSDKETSFLDLNIKVVGSDVHISVYDKRDDFGFPIVNFPWFSGDVPRLPSYVVYISQLVRFARCCTSVSDYPFQKSSNFFQTTDTGLQISKASKIIRKVLQIILWPFI